MNTDSESNIQYRILNEDFLDCINELAKKDKEGKSKLDKYIVTLSDSIRFFAKTLPQYNEINMQIGCELVSELSFLYDSITALRSNLQ